jgi:hypothetical protein
MPIKNAYFVFGLKTQNPPAIELLAVGLYEVPACNLL